MMRTRRLASGPGRAFAGGRDEEVDNPAPRFATSSAARSEPRPRDGWLEPKGQRLEEERGDDDENGGGGRRTEEEEEDEDQR